MKYNTKYGVVAALTLAAFVAPSVGAYTKTGTDTDYSDIYGNNKTLTLSNSEKVLIANCIKGKEGTGEGKIATADVTKYVSGISNPAGVQEADQSGFASAVFACITELTNKAKIFNNTVDGGEAAERTDDLKDEVKTAETGVTNAERAVSRAKTDVARAEEKYKTAVARAKASNPDYTDDEIAEVETVSDAKSNLESKQFDLELAQIGLETAKDTLADAKKELADNEVEVAKNRLKSAEDRLTDAQEALDTAKDDLTTAKYALEDAQDALKTAKKDNPKGDHSELETAVSAAKTRVSNAETEVKIKEKIVAAAEKLVTTEKEGVDKAEDAAKTDVAEATVSGVARAYTYNGNAIAPAVTVKLGDTTLAAGTDYTVDYKNNTEVGTATITITGKGNYSGTKTVKFYIDPVKSSIKKVSVGAKKMTVTVKKGTKASGVQIGYRVKGTSKWSYTKTTSTSKTIKSLKKGKKYQIVVRSYTTKSGKVTNYSGWSAIKATAAVK